MKLQLVCESQQEHTDKDPRVLSVALLSRLTYAHELDAIQVGIGESCKGCFARARHADRRSFARP